MITTQITRAYDVDTEDFTGDWVYNWTLICQRGGQFYSYGGFASAKSAMVFFAQLQECDPCRFPIVTDGTVVYEMNVAGKWELTSHKSVI